MKLLLIISQLALAGFAFGADEQGQLSPEKIEYCLHESESRLLGVETPPLLLKAYYTTKPMGPQLVYDTSHELAAKVQAMFTPEQQIEFDEGCRSYWLGMSNVRSKTSCGKALLPFLSVYSFNREPYMARHQLLKDRLEMYELCVTVRCKQAYDKKQARLNNA